MYLTCILPCTCPVFPLLIWLRYKSGREESRSQNTRHYTKLLRVGAICPENKCTAMVFFLRVAALDLRTCGRTRISNSNPN